MTDIHLFKFVGDRNRWLALRQSAVAQNIANVNTPGFRAVDVKSFEEAIASTHLAMARTSEAHMSLGPPDMLEAQMDEANGGVSLHSGNNVSLEIEASKAGEIAREYSLNTSIQRSFNRMMLLSARG